MPLKNVWLYILKTKPGLAIVYINHLQETYYDGHPLAPLNLISGGQTQVHHT